MKRLGDVDSARRRLVSVMAAGAARVPFLALGRKSAGAMGWNPARDDRPGGRNQGCCCLLKGTKISTPTGVRPVEDLRIGDDVETLSGPKAIKWIGYRKYTREKDQPWQASVMPVRVARGAIDDRVPRCDLYLSPEHCAFINGTLIPVKHLVNGTTIAPAAPAGMTGIEYYHIEFDTHEVIHAEGAPVESFMEAASNREYFSNFVHYERLYGRERQQRTTPFAPVFRYRNRRQKAAGLARSIVSSVVDVRDPIRVARDQLARRAQALRV
jgi:hypothetical protein